MNSHASLVPQVKPRKTVINNTDNAPDILFSFVMNIKNKKGISRTLGIF